jgi:hypothetical protein
MGPYPHAGKVALLCWSVAAVLVNVGALIANAAGWV